MTIEGSEGALVAQRRGVRLVHPKARRHVPELVEMVLDWSRGRDFVEVRIGRPGRTQAGHDYDGLPVLLVFRHDEPTRPEWRHRVVLPCYRERRAKWPVMVEVACTRALAMLMTTPPSEDEAAGFPGVVEDEEG